ncbi:MAG: endonuclease/exonuclease/phosphatase family protein, partial [Pseudomonadota bacterium]
MLEGLRQAVFALVVLVCAGLFAGFWGEAHPAADSAAAFRVHLLIVLGALGLPAVFLRGWGAFGIAAAAAAATLWATSAFLLPPGSPERADLRLFSQNLRFSNPEAEAVIAAVRGFDADVVVLQEVSEITRPVFDTLARRYEVAEFCPFGGVGGVAVLARLPLAGDVLCARGQGLLLVPLETEAGPIAFASVHLPWPWPHRQAELSQRIAGLLAERRERMVIAGDFNMAPWGA